MKFILSILFIQSFLVSNCQEYYIKNNKLLNFLYTEKNSVTSITNANNTNLLIKMNDPHFERYNQIILKNGKGLFILIEGTGRVFKAKSLSDSTIYFNRIDSTHLYGYNNSCMYFSFNDTTYSFGGSGFWRYNGQLRYFSELYNEWQIHVINKEIPASNILYYIDPLKKSVYYLQTPYKDPSLGYDFNNYIIGKLNISNKENLEIGKLTEKFQMFFSKSSTSYFSFINIPSLNGTLVNFNSGNQYLVNYEKNEVFRLASPTIKDIFFGSSENIQACNTFELNNKIYYTKLRDSTFKVYSFPVSMKDFVKEPYPLYESIDGEKTKIYFSLAGVGILLIGGSFFYVKKKRNSTQENIIQTPIGFNKDEDAIEFNPLEFELIMKMINQSKKGDYFSVDDVNFILGLNKKTLEIQKKVRTETINRINHKFKIKYNLSADLIERIRSEEDRRFYKYSISEENGKII